MFSHALSATTYGISAHIVEVETHITPALASFAIVGLPDNAIKESRDRVFAAIKTSGFRFPGHRITVNLAPADFRKEGSAFDLCVAVGIVAATGQVQTDLLDRFVLLGELALDGALRPTHGVLPMALETRRRGLRGILLPRENAREAAIIEGIDVFPMASLNEAVRFLNGLDSEAKPVRVRIEEIFDRTPVYASDFSEVKGQENVKRAIEVAAAGGHNIIMIGPPGSGKTMLAKRLPSILPPMTFDESIETTKIHSVAGLIPSGSGLVTARPFRAPHHTISDSALVGGGSIPRPGEISLAHHGVLFLDELPEFARNVLEVLRQPIEDNRVTISRSKMSIEYPANFMLVCAMNPCPCGFFSDAEKECTCSPVQIQRYMAKISGPLLDRIDLHIEVPSVKYTELASKTAGESSSNIRERVVAARDVQRRRFAGKEGIFCNADMQSKQIHALCSLDAGSEELLRMAITKLGLSARAYDRILKVSRTIADLGNCSAIRPEHVSEAIQYRSLDRNLWQV